MAATTALGPLDALAALHDAVGAFAALADVPSGRARAGIDDALLLRTLAVLPFVGNTGLRGVADQLFRDPAVLLQLGWSPVQIGAGDNGRHRHAEGRQPESLPCHPDTLRDALARIGAAAWRQVQRAGVAGLYRHRLVRGGTYAVDGTGLSATQRVVALVCVSGRHPLVVAWRYLEGSASEKGQEASVTRALVEQVLALSGPGCIDLLLADALYADGPLLAWLKCVHGIDALVRAIASSGETLAPGAAGSPVSVPAPLSVQGPAMGPNGLPRCPLSPEPHRVRPAAAPRGAAPGRALDQTVWAAPWNIALLSPSVRR